MARSERSLAPTEIEIQRWEQNAAAKRRFDAQRHELIEAALRGLKKEELIAIVMNLDVYDSSVRWSIEAELDLQKPVELIVHDLRHAIDIATKVDESRLNSNFDYSWQAYEEVHRAFSILIVRSEVEHVMEVAVEFMGKASYQLECSDEGMMLEEIEKCIVLVIGAVRAQDSARAQGWAPRMRIADRVGLICDTELRKLAGVEH